MNTVERIKSICKERKIAISKLEKECGFSNGYIGQLRKGTVPDDRLRVVAKYLDLSVEYLMTGEERQMDYLYTNENSDLLIEITMKLKSDKAFAERMARYMRLSDEGKKYADNSIDLMYLKEHEGED